MVEATSLTQAPAQIENFNKNAQVQLSKYLSFVLRHGAEKEGIAIQPDGFVKVADILAKPKLKNQWKVNFEHVLFVVNSNDKKRFELKEVDGVQMIRAV